MAQSSNPLTALDSGPTRASTEALYDHTSSPGKWCHSGPGGTYPEHPGVHRAALDEALSGQRSSWSGGCKDSFRQREITPFACRCHYPG